MVENVAYILAIEVLAAGEGLDFLVPLEPGIGTGVTYRFVRERVPHLDEDRVLAVDINIIYELIRTGACRGGGSYGRATPLKNGNMVSVGVSVGRK